MQVAPFNPQLVSNPYNMPETEKPKPIAQIAAKTVGQVALIILAPNIAGWVG